MSDTEIRKALELLQKAHDILADSEVTNLKTSAEYLEQSIVWLQKQEQSKNRQDQ